MERMKVKKFLAGAILLGLMAFAVGCHESSDGYRGYSRGWGNYSSDREYRDGFRDGRAYERRTDDRYGRYRDRDWWYR